MAKLTFLGLKDLNPLQQALVCAVLICIFSLGCLALQQRSMTAWNLIISPVILYAFLNPILGIFTGGSRIKYVLLSFVCFVALGFFDYTAGNLVSLVKYAESRELILFTFLIAIFYFMVYFLSFIFKGVLGFLEDIDK